MKASDETAMRRARWTSARRRHRQGEAPRPDREAAPSYRKLISRWENQGWNSEASTSPSTPRSGTTTRLHRSRALHGSASQFFLGEGGHTERCRSRSRRRRTISASSPRRSPTRPPCVFFDRFYREVLGADARRSPTTSSSGERQRRFQAALRRHPPRRRRELRSDPRTWRRWCGDDRLHDRDRGDAGAHRARFILRASRRWTGCRASATASPRNRDESRHVGFGVKFLADAIKEDALQEVVQDAQETLGGCSPSAAWVEDRYDFETPLATTPEMFEYAMRSLSKSSRRWGWSRARRAPCTARARAARPTRRTGSCGLRGAQARRLRADHRQGRRRRARTRP